MPPAPGLLSTITCWPSFSVRCSATSRAVMSDTPAPAANGTTTRRGWLGQVWAELRPVVAASRAPASAPRRVMSLMVGFLLAPVELGNAREHDLARAFEEFEQHPEFVA